MKQQQLHNDTKGQMSTTEGHFRSLHYISKMKIDVLLLPATTLASKIMASAQWCTANIAENV